MIEIKKLKNFIPLSRDVFEHNLWLEDRSFSKFEAWLYLIKEARFEDSRVLDGNTIVEVKRGQIYASIRFLSKAWGWGEKKVRLFLDFLVLDSMIEKGTANGTTQTLITICNYDKYNVISERKDTDGGTVMAQQGHDGGTVRAQQGHDEGTKSNIENIENNINTDNKEKNRILYVEFINSFNQIKGSKYKPTNKVEIQFNARLKEDFTVEQMLTALKNAMKSRYHMETEYKYLTPEFFTRSDKIEMYLNESNNNQSSGDMLELVKNRI